MRIRPVRFEVFRAGRLADGQTDRQDEANLIVALASLRKQLNSTNRMQFKSGF
jgi:hypothetical protein